MSEYPVGAHLVSPRMGYTHHGIYIGNGRVLHYSGKSEKFVGGAIEGASLVEFSKGNSVQAKTYKRSFPADVIISRARSREGENAYCMLGNNCEHFCLWCIVGDHTSAQVDKATIIGTPATGLTVGVAARAVIAASGPVAGLSGAGVMSGLATTGAVVGGGAVAGIAVIGGVPAVAAASLVNKTLLKDDPVLDSKERESRATGRVASVTGAVAGTAGSIAAVSAAGTTAGLSAAGITSGLAAIGSTATLGAGGMAAGVVVVSAAPVAIAAGVGYGVYKLIKWLKS